MNLIGEHTDYNEGFALPIAIDRNAIVVAATHDAPQSTFYALDLESEFQVEFHGARLEPRRGHWSNYLLGVAHQFIDRGHSLPGLNVAFSSTVPMGAGLSSSAAIVVAMATLLEQVTGEILGPLEKALLCMRAEQSLAGVPCGILDMLVATSAREGCALLMDCRSNSLQPVPLNVMQETAELLLINTGVRRELASGEYADRRCTCESVSKTLGIQSLRDATLEMLADESLTELQRRRASHVVTENTRTLLACAALMQGDLQTLGSLMFDSHRSLRELYEVSCPELDAIVDAAARIRGDGGSEHSDVIGARMTGGGFGGCALVLCRRGAARPVGEFITREFAARFPSPATAFQAAASGPTNSIDLAHG